MTFNTCLAGRSEKPLWLCSDCMRISVCLCTAPPWLEKSQRRGVILDKTEMFKWKGNVLRDEKGYRGIRKEIPSLALFCFLKKKKQQSILLTWSSLNVSVIWNKAEMDTQERQLSHEHFVVMISLKREALARCWTWTERKDFGKFNISTLCNTTLHTNIGFSIYPYTFLQGP